MAGRMPKRTLASQLRDLAIYVGVAFGMLLGVWVLVAYDIRRGGPPDPARVNWLILGLVTCVVYINAIHEGGRLRRSPRFWGGLGLALLVQLVVEVAALWKAPRIHVYIWTIAALLNMAVLDLFMRWWLMAGSTRRGLSGGRTRVSGPLRQGEE